MMPNKMITYQVLPSWEERAMDIRQKRDAQYPNIYLEEPTDMRWVGDLGEIVFNHWMKEEGIGGFEWHLDNAAGKPDFTVNGIRIDVKTVKRKVPPEPHYTAQITARHISHPIDELFFLSYEFLKKKMWLLGGAKMSAFIQFARYYGEGEYVHKDYQIRKGHEIYNGEISLLESPESWITQFR
jgi:hypothetical protein